MFGIKRFFHSTGSESSDSQQCVICGDVVRDVSKHVNKHKGISRKERKLLRSYYRFKEDGSRLRLVWIGNQEEVMTDETFDVSQKESPERARKPEARRRSFARGLTTFRKPQPPKIVQEAIKIFLDIEKNISPKGVTKRLEDAGYNLEKDHVNLIYNKVKSAYNNHMK